MRVLLPILFLLSNFHHARSDLSEGTKALFQGASGIAADTVFPEPSQAHLNQFEFDVPSRDDMAIHRLHLSIRNMTEKVRKTLGDPQRKAILERNNDGSIHQGILKIFAEVQGDVFALSNAISEAKAEGIFKSLASLDNDSTEVLKWKESWAEISVIVGKAKLLYSFLDQYMTKAKQEESIGRDTLVDFAQSILNPQVDSTSLINAMERLHALSSVGPDDDGIYSRLRDLLTTEHGRYTCDLNRSVYDLTWDLYNIISHTEKKGYLTIAFAFELLREFKFGNYTIEYRFLENALADHNQEKMWSVQALLPQVSRVVRRCDPPKQIEGVTYLRMTQLLQGFLINEVDMNTKKTCKKECQDYKVATETSCFNQLFCSKQRSCNGRLFDCTFYDADSWVCMSDTEERRYDWVHYEQGTLLGKKEGRCINKIKVDSWWRWLLYHCSYCLCKCDAPSPSSDRYWSLKPSESDLSSNKVVTGLRFVKKGRVLGLEVQQARALPEAFIDGQTKEWVESKDAIDVNNSELKNVDFMEMSYEQRAMDLDVIDAPEGHVVTGARFRNIGGHLNLEMKVTPIDYSTGKLIVEASSWIGNDITPATSPAREFMDIPYPDVPTNYNGTSLLIAERDQYIMFDTTSGDKDVMQTTIPFIDSQPVETDTWLSGLGIYYKGTIGYGGYIGASVYNYDFSQYFKL